MLCALVDSETYSVGDMGSSNLGQTIRGSDIIFDFELRTTLIATYLSVTHNSERYLLFLD